MVKVGKEASLWAMGFKYKIRISLVGTLTLYAEHSHACRHGFFFCSDMNK